MKPPLRRIEEFLDSKHEPDNPEWPSRFYYRKAKKLEAALKEAAKDLKTLKAVGTLERIADILEGGEI